MENIKAAFFKLLKEDLPRFILVMTQTAFGFLFFISLYLPFVKGPEIINGSVSMSVWPGSFFYELILLVLFPLFLLLILTGKDKLARKTLLVQNIIALLVFLYGVLFYRVGLSEAPSTTGAYGKFLEFILLIGMWFAFLKPNIVLSLIKKFVKEPDSSEQTSSQADMQFEEAVVDGTEKTN